MLQPPVATIDQGCDACGHLNFAYLGNCSRCGQRVYRRTTTDDELYLLGVDLRPHHHGRREYTVTKRDD